VHCGSARLDSPVTGHHHAARGAVTGLYAACAQYTVTRRAVLETGGLPWCQPTCPVCQWHAILFNLGAPGPTTALNAVRWVGDPRRASCHRHVAGPAPLPPRGRHVAAPDPFPRGGGSGPPRPVGAVRAVMVWPSHVAAPDLPGESESAEATRELPWLHGHVEAPDL
jgi:hypothetical protein